MAINCIEKSLYIHMENEPYPAKGLQDHMNQTHPMRAVWPTIYRNKARSLFIHIWEKKSLSVRIRNNPVQVD
jgi:hypothetical protein